MTVDSLAVVGAAGGVGTTRVTLECAATLARQRRDVVVLDAAYETQGLADHVPGRIDPDMTALCLDDGPLESGVIDLDVEAGGRLAACPARAPFERLARGKTTAAAEGFERRIAEATRAFDHVLIDTPPVAANQSVAAVSAADGVAVVCDAPRAADALARTRDRLTDVGVDDHTTVVTNADDHPDADVTVPTLREEPTARPEGGMRASIAELCAATLGVEIEIDDGGGFAEYLP